MRTIEQQLDTRELRRIRSEDKWHAKRCQLEAKCEDLIGHIHRADGLTYYINLVPLSKGKIKESKSAYDLIDYLIRNHYVV